MVGNVDTFTNKKDLALTLQGISTTAPVPMIILDYSCESQMADGPRQGSDQVAHGPEGRGLYQVVHGLGRVGSGGSLSADSQLRWLMA